jgi:hypothetical protein
VTFTPDSTSDYDVVNTMIIQSNDDSVTSSCTYTELTNAGIAVCDSEAAAISNNKLSNRKLLDKSLMQKVTEIPKMLSHSERF